MNRYLRHSLAASGLFGSLLLSSCNPFADGDSLKHGAFIDGPVEGLRFQTTSQSGFTDATGAFSYIDGEMVTFYVGDILLGEAAGAATISSFDLAGIAPPQADADIVKAVSEATHRLKPTPLDHAINSSVFLQTLDDDGDPSNGIRIPESLHALATNTEIDVNTKTYVFRRRFGLSAFLATARASGVWSEPRRMRDAADALDSLYANLKVVPEIYRKKTQELTSDLSIHASKAVYTYDTNGELIERRYEPRPDQLFARRVATGIPVAQYVPSPSQNRTRSVTPSGSQLEASTMVWGRDYAAHATMASNLSGFYQTAPT